MAQSKPTPLLQHTATHFVPEHLAEQANRLGIGHGAILALLQKYGPLAIEILGVLVQASGGAAASTATQS